MKLVHAFFKLMASLSDRQTGIELDKYPTWIRQVYLGLKSKFFGDFQDDKT